MAKNFEVPKKFRNVPKPILAHSGHFVYARCDTYSVLGAFGEDGVAFWPKMCLKMAKIVPS